MTRVKFMAAATLGKNSGTKLEQWSVTLLPIGKARAVDNMALLCFGFDNLRALSAYAEP